jgi:hypothetical protein
MDEKYLGILMYMIMWLALVSAGFTGFGLNNLGGISLIIA